MKFLELDDNGYGVQGFAPDPAKSIQTTVITATTYTKNTMDDLAVQFIADGDLFVSIDNGITQYPMPAGMTFAIVTVRVDSIRFTNDSGADVTLYGLVQ